MPRIAGINLPDNKRIEIALTHIYGIGRPLANKILAELKIDPNLKMRQLDAGDLNRLRNYLESKFKIEGTLRQEILFNIKRLKDINAYRGMRHARHLPVRGQQTRTNSRTVRSNIRKTVGSGRRSAAEKT